jgi:mannose-6-phosphate isomerase-like protein (cupin superfamily)
MPTSVSSISLPPHASPAPPWSPHRLRAKRSAALTALVRALPVAALSALAASTPSRAGDGPTPTPTARSPVVSLDAALAAAQAPPGSGAIVTEILRGDEASANAWRITDVMPPHLHREHEEIIIVRSGRARARIGDRDVDLGPGDVFLVPKNTVHAARAIGEEPFEGVSVFAPAFDGRDRVPVPATAASPVP